MINKNGLLYFHQGWTDIINCLALINYYCERYNKIYLIMREDARELIDFYTCNINNLQILYEGKQNIDENGIYYVINKYRDKYIDLQDCDFLGIGGHDNIRKDNYKNKFRCIDNCFVKGFYESYNIPYIERINSFNIVRNYELEEDIYNNFIEKYENEYILYHEVIENYDTNTKIINLNQISSVYFDYIKVLENAIEIHLLDSSWAAICYLLDAKYKLFQNRNIPIYLYAKRGYSQMFIDPVKLDNWTII
jgi:hypothetical protein